MPNDVIITPGSGRIQFVKDVGQELTRFNIDLSPTNGLILDTALTCSVGIKAPNMLDSFGNNTFAGTSTFNGPTVINGDLSVFGATNIFSASNVYITSSNLTVTDNILTLNALTPYQRYAGIEMFDSGSNTKSQFLWDGQGDYFFISGSGVNGKIITGPDGQSDLTSGYVPKATAGYKLGNSVMYDDGTRVGIGTTAPSGSLTIQSNGTQLRLQTASGPSSYYATIDALYNSTHPFQIAVAGNSVNTAEYFGIYADAGGSNPRIALLNGNVGVGLTNPSAKFHVTSSTNADEVLIGTIGDNQIIGGRTGGSFGIATKSTSNGNLILTSGDALYIRTSGSNDRVIVKNDGNVGIGTTNPLTRLTSYVGSGAISGTNDAIRLQVASYNNGGRNTIVWAQDTGNLVLGRYGLEWNGGTSQMNFVWRDVYNNGVASTELMRLTGGGNLGIGTTSPTTKFHVSGSHVGGNGMSRFEASDYSIISLKAPGTGDGSFGYWGFRAQDKGDNDLMFYGYVYTSAFSGFRIDPSFAGSIPRGFFVRNSDGSVGVGTNVPNAKLNVNSSGSLASGSVVFRVEGTQGSLFSVDDSLSGSLMSVNDISGLPILEVFSDDRVVAGTFNSNTFVVTGSRVGIGTNIPTAKLQVGTNSISGTSNNSGNVRIGQSNAAGAVYGLALANTATATVGNESALSFIVASDYSATGIISTVLRNTSTAASDLVFTNYNNGLNERMRIQYDGNVGIGTTSPTQKLEVAGYIMAGEGLYRTNIYGSNGGAWIGFGDTSSLNSLGRIGAYGALFNINSLNNDISFQYNSAEKMRITTGGHLGLGITDPTAYVNANGNWFRPSLNGLYSSVFATTEAVINLISSGSADGAAVGGVYFTRARAQGDAHFQIAAIRAIQTGTSNTIAGGALQFFTKANGGGTTATTPQMVIWNDGNVGIGTANPTRPLHISSSNNAPVWIQGTTAGAWLDFQSSTSNLLSIGADGTNGIGFYNRTNSTYLAVINNTGNLGVGTSSPGATLDLWASAARIKFRRTSSYDMSFGIHDSSTSALSIKNSGDANTIAYFQYDGNVGIGTTSFAYANSNRGNVEIYGSTDALIALRNATANSYIQKTGNDFYLNNGGAGIIYFQNNGSNRVVIDSNGNVGIATTTPSSRLQIGSLTSTQTSATEKLSLGGTFSNSPGANVKLKVYEDGSGGAIGGMSVSSGQMEVNTWSTGKIAFYRGTTQTAIIDDVGNVGIGTSTPNSKLNVVASNTPGVSILSNNSGQYAYLYVGRTANDLSVGVSGGTDQFFVGTVAGDAIIKKESGNRLMLGVGSGAPTITINSSNFLGLGTTTPSASLHVNSTTAGATLIRADGTNGTLFSVVDDLSDSLMSVNNSAGLPILEVFADDRIVAGQYGQNDFVVRNNRVGIGTNNPQYKLDVTGSFGLNASASDTNWAFVVSDNSSAGSRYSLNKLGSMGFNYADTYAQLQLLGAAGAYVDFTHVSGGDSNARLIYYANDRIDLTYGFTTTLTLRSSNAGIGTTAPRSGFQINTINGSSANEYAGLTVSATVSASRGVNIAYDATNDIGVIQPVHNGVTWKNLSLVPQGGGVGIGNTSPSYKLHVSGDIYANGGWFRVSGTQGYYFETYGGGWFMNDNTWIRSYNSKNIWSGTGLIGSDGGLTVGYNGASPTSLGAIISGSVGIGTSSPSYKLHVVGTGYYSSTLQVNSNITLSGGGDVIINDSDGTGAFNSFMDSGVGYIRIDDGGSANGSLNINSGLLFVSGSSSAVGVNTSNFSYASNDNSRFVGSNTNNKLFVNGSIQLLNDNDAIVIGRGTATFLTDEELGFGWGGGWYMTDTTYLRVRNNKVLYNNGEIWGTIFKDSSNTAYYLDPASTSVLYSIAAGVAGNSSANIPALKVTSAGTATTQAAIAIQQQTSEGDTIIFCDYAQYVEYNFMHENATNQFIIHGGASTGNLGSNTFYSPDGTAKTGYIKHVFETDNGNAYHGGNIGIGTNVTNARVESYYSSNAITFNYLATNLNVNSPIPVYGFDVTSGAETRSIKAGIGYERHLPNGRGTLHFYNDSTNDTASLVGNRTTAGDIKMSLDNSGNLGIGTTQPSWLLTVYAASAPQFALQNGTRSFILTNNSGDNLLSFNYGSVNRLQFDTTNQWFNTGNLGVGNTSPQYKLHVTQATPSGAIAAPANTSIQVDSNTNNYISFVNSSDNGTYAGLTFVDNNIGGYIVFRNYTGDVTTGSDSLIYGTYQDHIFQTGTAAINSRNEVMRIKNGGNVGIGSNNPQYKLDVNGAANFNGVLSFNGVAVLNTVNNSNDIYANVRVIRNTSTVSSDGMYINYDSLGTTAAHIRFYANAGNERMRIQANDGNVGIGTTSAGRRLDVEGIVRTRGASGTGGFEIGAASTGAARWRIEWDSASDSLDFNWVA